MVAEAPCTCCMDHNGVGPPAPASGSACFCAVGAGTGGGATSSSSSYQPDWYSSSKPHSDSVGDTERGDCCALDFGDLGVAECMADEPLVPAKCHWAKCWRLALAVAAALLLVGQAALAITSGSRDCGWLMENNITRDPDGAVSEGSSALMSLASRRRFADAPPPASKPGMGG